MKKQMYPLFLFLVLVLLVTACAPSIGNGGEEPSSEDQVATIVAGTMQALTPSASESTPEPAAGLLLPRSLYYLGVDNATGITQIFRMERDGVTNHQVTFEPIDVKSYDVSQTDGSVAYVSNNQLLSINADGSNRGMLVDGGVMDPNSQMSTSVSNPIFSPDGLTIVYGLRGLNSYSIIDGVSIAILPQQIDGPSGTVSLMYAPKSYSPDGTKILITLAIPNSDGITSGIFTPATNSLVQLSGEGAIFCCDQQGWNSDGSALYAAYSSMGMFMPGLWRVDAVTGVVTTLIEGDAGNGTFNLPDEPYLAPDGQLYYFFANAPASDGFINREPLQIVRSGLDGVTGRTIINANTFQFLNDVLWAHDASLVIVALAPDQDTYYGGRAEVTYFDGRPSVVLTPFAQQMKWGP